MIHAGQTPGNLVMHRYRMFQKGVGRLISPAD